MAYGQDSQLALERVQRFLGTADIQLSQLTDFYDSEPALDPDKNRVEVLERKLRQSNIRDGIQEHHFRAVVSTESLDRALQTGRLSRAAFLERCHDPTNFPKLDFTHGGLTCLGGQARVLAALKIPPWGRRCWPVDLYHEDISSGLRMQLRDKIHIQAPLSDGEIFLTFQRFKRAGKISLMNHWGAYLSKNKEQRLYSVAKTEWGMILDSLSLIPGLWQLDEFIGKLHTMRSFHANSEYVHYLTQIKECFGEAFKENPALMAKLTAQDTCALQGAASGPILEELIAKGDLLKAFGSSEKEKFYRFLSSRPYMIPTVFTFFQDAKLIGQCAPMVLRLIDANNLVAANGSKEPDIKASLRYMFEKESTAVRDHLQIQVSEEKSRTVKANSHLRFELAYRQLWLYTIRHFVRPDHRKHRTIKFHIDNESEIQLLSVFASNLGFTSASITTLMSRSAAKSRSRVIRDETSGIENAESNQMYGIPDPASWQWDRDQLYLDRIYSAPQEPKSITTFFVLQSVFYNFFGYPEGFTPVNTIPEPGNAVPPTTAANTRSNPIFRNQSTFADLGNSATDDTQNIPPTFTEEQTFRHQSTFADPGKSATDDTQNIPPTFTEEQTFRHQSTFADPGKSATDDTQNIPPTFTEEQTFRHQSTFADPGKSATDETQNNPPTFNASSDDMTDLSMRRGTIEKIDVILAELEQTQTIIRDLKNIMLNIRQAIPLAKSDIQNYLNSKAGPVPGCPDYLDARLDYTEKSLEPHISGLEYALKLGLQLDQHLRIIKENLQQSPLVRIVALAQVTDIEFYRYKYIRNLVEQDEKYAEEMFTNLGWAKHLREVSSIMTMDKCIEDFMNNRTGMEHIIQIAQMGEDWNAELRQIGKTCDQDAMTWAVLRAKAPTSSTSLGSLNAISCSALIEKHTEWVNEFNSYSKAFDSHSTHYHSVLDKVKEGLSMWMTKLENELAVRVLDEEISRAIQQELTQLRAHNPTWDDLQNYRNRLQAIDNQLNLNNVNLGQNAQDTQIPAPAQSNVMSAYPQLDRNTTEPQTLESDVMSDTDRFGWNTTEPQTLESDVMFDVSEAQIFAWEQAQSNVMSDTDQFGRNTTEPQTLESDVMSGVAEPQAWEPAQSNVMSDTDQFGRNTTEPQTLESDVISDVSESQAWEPEQSNVMSGYPHSDQIKPETLIPEPDVISDVYQNALDPQIPSESPGVGSEVDQDMGYRSDRLSNHVEVVRKLFVQSGMDSENGYNDATERYLNAFTSFKSAPTVENFKHLREEAISMENTLYQMIRDVLERKSDIFFTAQSLTKKYRNFQVWAVSRHEGVQEDIEKDPSKGTNEENSLQKGRKMFLELFNYEPRSSERGEVKIKLWIITDTQDCRPLLVTIKKEALEELGRYFMKLNPKFELQLLRSLEHEVRPIPINLGSKSARETLKQEDTIGLLAYREPWKYEVEYGNQLKDSHSFSEVKWTQSFCWEKCSNLKDFMLEP